MSDLGFLTDEVTIVALGSFNPAIFHPTWFSLNGMVTSKVADATKVRFISPEISSFQDMDSIDLFVESAKLIMQTDSPSAMQSLRDLVDGTLSVLEHTPITALGFNRIISIQNKSLFERTSKRLAALDLWEQTMVSPTLSELLVTGTRSDCNANSVQVRVIPRSDYIVQIIVNQHYDLTGNQPDKQMAMFRALRDDWRGFLTFAANVPSDLSKKLGAP